MAYKLIWSPAARDDLHDIVVFIARDSPERAEDWELQNRRPDPIRCNDRILGPEGRCVIAMTVRSW